MARLSLTCSFVIASMLVGTFATAEEPSSARANAVLRAWSAPRECPPMGDVEERFRERLPAGADVHARARVEKTSAGYRLTLEIESQGERILEGATCDAVVASAAVVTGMSQAGAADEETSSEPEPAPSRTASPPLDQRSKDRSEAPRVPPSPTLALRVEVVGDAGLLPSAALGGGGAIGWKPIARVVLELSGDVFASQDGPLPNDRTRGATFSMFAGTARGCWMVGRSFEAGACLGIEVLRIGAKGFGSARTDDVASATWAPEWLLSARAAIAGPVGIRGGLGGVLPIARQAFVITPQGVLHRADAVAFRFFLGPEVRF